MLLDDAILVPSARKRDQSREGYVILTKGQEIPPNDPSLGPSLLELKMERRFRSMGT